MILSVPGKKLPNLLKTLPKYKSIILFAVTYGYGDMLFGESNCGMRKKSPILPKNGFHCAVLVLQ